MKLFDWHDLVNRTIERVRYEQVEYHSLQVYFTDGTWAEVMSTNPAMFPVFWRDISADRPDGSVVSEESLEGKSVSHVHVATQPDGAIFWDCHVQLFFEDGEPVYLVSEDEHTPLVFIDTFDPG